MSEFNDTLERISMQLEQIEESLPRRPLWKRRLLEDLLSGAARGIGFSIGFTVAWCAASVCDCKALRSPTCPLLANFWQNWCAL